MLSLLWQHCQHMALKQINVRGRHALKYLFNSGLFPRSSSNVIYNLIIVNKFILNLIFACEIIVYRKVKQLQQKPPSI